MTIHTLTWWWSQSTWWYSWLPWLHAMYEVWEMVGGCHRWMHNAQYLQILNTRSNPARREMNGWLVGWKIRRCAGCWEERHVRTSTDEEIFVNSWFLHLNYCVLRILAVQNGILHVTIITVVLRKSISLVNIQQNHEISNSRNPSPSFVFHSQLRATSQVMPQQ